MNIIRISFHIYLVIILFYYIYGLTTQTKKKVPPKKKVPIKKYVKIRKPILPTIEQVEEECFTCPNIKINDPFIKKDINICDEDILDPKFLIIIKIQEKNPHLQRLIDSLRKQTFRSFQVYFIIYNQNQNDTFLNSFTEEDKRIKIIDYSQNNDIIYPGAALIELDSDDIVYDRNELKSLHIKSLVSVPNFLSIKTFKYRNLLVRAICSDDWKREMQSHIINFSRDKKIIKPLNKDPTLILNYAVKSYTTHYKNVPKTYNYYLANSLNNAHFVNKVNIAKNLRLKKEVINLKYKKLFNFMKKNKKKLLIIDIDQTLVHTVLKKPNSVDVEYRPYKLKRGKNKYKYVLLRPWVRQFLKIMKKYFNIIIFTAGSQNYAKGSLFALDPEREILNFNLFREMCIYLGKKSQCLKDLRIFNNFFNMKNTVILDNSMFSFANQLSNGILINSFKGRISNDFELVKVAKYLLEYIKDSEDVRVENQKYFQFEYFINNINDVNTGNGSFFKLKLGEKIDDKISEISKRIKSKYYAKKEELKTKKERKRRSNKRERSDW